MKSLSLIILIVSLFLLPFTIFAETHFVRLRTGLCQGQVSLKLSRQNQYVTVEDTVIFSNNISLIGVKGELLLPWMLVGQILYFHVVDSKRWGNLYIVGGYEDDVNLPSGPETLYYNRDDHFSSFFPESEDSLVLVENIHYYDVLAKTLYSTDTYYHSHMQQWFTELVVFRDIIEQIFYAEDTDGRWLKFQVQNQNIDPESSEPVIIRWAASGPSRNSLTQNDLVQNSYTISNSGKALKILHNSSRFLNVAIYNMLGKKIIEKSLKESDSNIFNLIKGVYLIRIKNGKEEYCHVVALH